MSFMTSAFTSALPEHCVPQNDFLLRFSSTFHTCVPTPLAFISNTLGALSIVAWLFAQLPQIYKNWSIGSTSGLSIFFLVEWCLGDISNLLGALFTHQASWQVAIGAYYVFVDLCLVGQWVWYEKLRHGHPVFRMRRRGDSSRRRDGDDSSSSENTDRLVTEGMPIQSEESGVVDIESDDVPVQNSKPSTTTPRVIFRTPTFFQEKANSTFSGTPSSSTINRVGSSSPMPSPSPRTILFVACLIAMAHASPISTPGQQIRTLEAGPTPLEKTGTILSWISTVLYLGSRLPQLAKNFRRKSTSGLSPHLFIAAFCGNCFYSSAIATNPCAWSDFGPYGGGGWVGEEGSNRTQWVLAALPFFIGAFGVLGLDGGVGIQFLIYGEGTEKLVVVEQEPQGRRWHLRRVSGWLRGWVPSTDQGRRSERQVLLDGERQHGEGYGAL